MFVKKNSTKNGRIFLTLAHGYSINGKTKHKTVENLGYLDDLQKIYDDPIAYFSVIAKQKTLVFNRILHPSSKKKAFDSKDRFFEKYEFSLEDIYKSLTFFNKYSLRLQKHLNDQVVKKYGRDDNIAYYDVTNYYFEIPYEDEDVIENGKVVKKGTRQKGAGKEHRPDPIRQMGLLMDSRNFPMAFNLFSGRESEKTSLLPIIRRIKKDYGIRRIIVVADRGLNTSDNTYFMSGKNDHACKNNNGYVYGQSVLGGDAKFKEYVLKKDGYTTVIKKNKDDKEYTFKSKSRVYAKKVTIKDSKGNRRLDDVIYQKQVVYWSSKYAAKQRKQRDLAIKKAEDLIADPKKYNKATSYGVIGYINNIKFAKDTGEISDGLNLSLKLDKIAEEEKYDGYYSIVTSEIKLSDSEIIKIYGGLWEIEESFRIMKSEFKTRPVYLSIEEHIDAHFLICFVSLLIFRIMEFKLENRFTTRQIRETLTRLECSFVHENYYMIDYRNEIVQELEKIFNMDFSNKFMKKSKIEKFLHNSKKDITIQ